MKDVTPIVAMPPVDDGFSLFRVHRPAIPDHEAGVLLKLLTRRGLFLVIYEGLRPWRKMLDESNGGLSALIPAGLCLCYLCRISSGARCRSSGSTLSRHSTGAVAGKKHVLVSHAW